MQEFISENVTNKVMNTVAETPKEVVRL